MLRSARAADEREANGKQKCSSHRTWVATPNDPKLRDSGARRAGCRGRSAGAASVTCVAVLCSAWLGVAVRLGNDALQKSDVIAADLLKESVDDDRSSFRCSMQAVNIFGPGVARCRGTVGETDLNGKAAIAMMVDVVELGMPVDSETNKSALNCALLVRRDTLNVLDNLKVREIGCIGGNLDWRKYGNL